MEGIGLLVLFGAVAIAAVALSWYLREKRRRELRLVATQLGLQYSARDGFGLLNLPLPLFRRGDGRRLENVLWGTWQGVDVREFDYSYYEESTDPNGRGHKTWHHFSCALTEVDLACSTLSIARENLLTRLADSVGFRDIEFESEEFNRRFDVRAEDLKFASDLIDARMIQWLLGSGDGWSFEVAGRWVLTSCKRRKPFELVPLLGTVKGFVERVPRVVHELYGVPSAG